MELDEFNDKWPKFESYRGLWHILDDTDEPILDELDAAITATIHGALTVSKVNILSGEITEKRVSALEVAQDNEVLRQALEKAGKDVDRLQGELDCITKARDELAARLSDALRMKEGTKIDRLEIKSDNPDMFKFPIPDGPAEPGISSTANPADMRHPETCGFFPPGGVDGYTNDTQPLKDNVSPVVSMFARDLDQTRQYLANSMQRESELASEKRNLLDQLTAARNEIDDARGEYADSILKLNADVGTLTEANGKLRAELDAANSKIRSMGEHLQILVSEKTSIEESNKKFADDWNKMVETNFRLRVVNEENKRTIDILQELVKFSIGGSDNV